ncbi:MAG: Eco47II family restriction endonuclease [Fusobacteriaceae bacterium]
MAKYNLGFISDEDLYSHVKTTVEKYRFKMTLKEFNKNLIDPIKLTFDSKIYQKNLEEVISDEISRQMDKSNNNHIGYFHQNIFKYFGNGWEVPKERWDVMNKKLEIYVEIKNKHNTMNSSSANATYLKMQNMIINNLDSKCYLVEVISKKSQDIIWELMVNKNKMSSQKIRKISIDKFYELVTGQTDSFKKLCEILPKVLDDVMSELKSTLIENSVFEELEKLDKNILKSLYLLSFKTYEGFGSLDIKF